MRLNSLLKFQDLTRLEFFLLIPLVCLIFFYGIYSIPLLDIVNISVNKIIYI